MATSVSHMTANRTHIPRPRSANRANEEAIPTKTGLYPAPRSKSDKERLQTTFKKPSVIPKRINNTSPPTGTKSVKTTNVVPKNVTNQRKLKEMKRAMSDSSQFNKGDPSSQTDLMQLKLQYQEKIVQFEKLITELHEKQKIVLDAYAKLQQTHKEMSSKGEKADLPPADELRVLNVTSSPMQEHLFNQCAEQALRDDNGILKSILSLDINKLNNLPNNLVSTCEQTLKKRKEIISWLDSLVKSKKKGIPFNNLIGKIDEFSIENEMLNCSLIKEKSDFLRELHEMMACLRKGVQETMQLHVRNEELTYELAELDAKNTSLRKQLHTSENLKSNSNRAKVEELEKALKDEKCKRAILRDRLTRTEGQVKMSTERAAQLEMTLDDSRSKIWNLERTVQQLNEQNERLQSDFDRELNNLTESIKENSVKLEEIAEDREKLQAQKEDLEKQLQQLSDYYNESLKNMKNDLKINVAKVIEAEKKYNAEIEERKKAEAKEETLHSQLRESQLRYMDLCKVLEEKENEIVEIKALREEFETTKQEMIKITKELEENSTKLVHQSSLICDLERMNKALLNDKENLKIQLSNKEDIITNLETKKSILYEQLRDNQNKMDSYEQQLVSLRSQMNELQEDFGNFENLNELRLMVNQQRAKLIEATRQNGELAEALQKKDVDLEMQSKLFKKHEDIVKKLYEKEKEHAEIIKKLNTNVEIKSQVESELNKKIIKKEEEVSSLKSSLDEKDQQISRLEMIILSFENQTRKQRKSDQDKIDALEKKMAEYEAHYADAQQVLESPPEHEAIDNLIKILENEIQFPDDPQPNIISNDIIVSKKNYIGDYHKNVKLENFTCDETNGNGADHDNVPTKIVMGNFVKKTYNISRNERSEKPDHKKAITNRSNSRKLTSSAAEGYDTDAPIKNNPMHFLKNFSNATSIHEERKYNKMLKLAGHRM